ncbi:MAG: MFS transporter [Anaerocolumna sp.]
MNEEEKIGYRQIFRQKEYMKTVIAAVINRFGDSIDSIAFTWLVYQITQSAAWSAIIFGVNRIPTILLQPFAGAAIEGKNKKRIMILTDLIRGFCVGFVATGFLCGFLNQWILLFASVLISCAEAFRGPASQSLLPKLLDKKYYALGLSLNSSACNVMELIGLGMAGAIISIFSVSTAIYIDMITFFLSALIILTVRVHENKIEQEKVNITGYIDTLRGGFNYLKNNAILKYFILLAVFLNAILVPFNSLQAPLITEVLKVNEIMLSILGISITLGMIIGAAIYPHFSNRLSKRFIASLGSYSIGIFYLVLVLTGRFITSEILIYSIIAISALLQGVGVATLTTFFNVEFMKNVKEDYIARVSAIFSACAVSAIPITSFVISFLAKFTPTVVIFLIAAIADISISILLCSKKRLNSIEHNAKENHTKMTNSEKISLEKTNTVKINTMEDNMDGKEITDITNA